MSGKFKNLILAAVLILSVFLITFRFTETPPVWIDEGIFLEVAKNLAWHGVQGFQIEPGYVIPSAIWATAGYTLIFPVATSFLFFGTGIWQARAPMLVYMFLLVGLFYLFNKKKQGFVPAVISILLLISFAPFYGNGRPVLGEVPGLVYLVLGCLSALYWEEGGFSNRWLALLAGVGLGLAASSKPLYLIALLPAIIAAITISFYKIKERRALYIFFLGLAAPLVVWLLVQFPTRELLFQAVPVYFSGNPDATASTSDLLSKNFKRFFTESTSMLFLALLIVVSIPVTKKIITKKGRNYTLAELILWFFIILIWLAFLKGPGWYRHFFPAHVLLYLLLPSALASLSRETNRKIVKGALLVAPIALIVVQFCYLVFFSQTSLNVVRTRNSALKAILSEISKDKKVFFYNTIEAAIFLKHDNYAQYFAPSDYFAVGNKSVLTNPTANFILINEGVAQKNNFNPPCYNKLPIDRYVLYQKSKNCTINQRSYENRFTIGKRFGYY